MATSKTATDKSSKRKPRQSKKPTSTRKKSAARKKTRPKAEEIETPFGALVGWASDDLGNRIRLRMQSTRSTPKSPDDIEEFHYYIDKDQAALLGNFLFRVSGQTAPDRSMPGWLRKLLKPE